MPVTASRRTGSADSTGRPAPSHVPRPTMRSGVRRAIATRTMSRTSGVVRGIPGDVDAVAAAPCPAVATTELALGAVMVPRRLRCAVPLTAAVNRYHLAGVGAPVRVE